MRTIIKTALVLAIVMLLPLSFALAQDGTSMLSYCWANGIMYALVIPTNEQLSTDLRTNIFVFHNLKGQRPIVEKGPGEVGFYDGYFCTTMVDFTPEGVKKLDPNSDGVAEFEITSSKMVQDFVKQGYLKITGKGADINAKLVSPVPYIDSPSK
jgi:hypothetical protein